MHEDRPRPSVSARGALAVVVGGVVWFLVARWLYANTGREIYRGFADGSCFAGDQAWAEAQGAVALVGLVATAGALAAALLGDAAPTALRRVLVGVALTTAVAWFVLVVGWMPREDLGVYAGCGAS